MITPITVHMRSFVLGLPRNGLVWSSSSEEHSEELSELSTLLLGISGELSISHGMGSVSNSLSDDFILTVTCQWCHFKGRAEIPYMVRDYVYQYGMFTDDISDPPFHEVGGALAIERHHPDNVSYPMWSTYFFLFRQTHTVSPFDSYPIGVDCIGRCTSSRHVIFWCHVISIHHFRDCTLLSGGNPFYTMDLLIPLMVIV